MNIIKDIITGVIQSQTGMRPGDVGKAIAKLLTRMMSEEEKSLWENFKDTGGRRMTRSSYFNQDTTYGELLGYKGKGKIQKTLDVPMQVLEFLSNHSVELEKDIRKILY